MSLHKIIKEKIHAQGAISVADYMGLALGHPEYGYYMRQNPFGKKGDFITAPEISQIFGELIGAWCADFWQRTGCGDLMLVELGPGRGTLMHDILRSTASVPGFHDALCITFIETSPALKDKQKALVNNTHSRCYWQDDLADLPRMPALFIANEFFDALPIRQFVKTEGGLKEKMVDLSAEDDALCFTIQEMGLKLVKGGSYSEDGIVVESCPAARLIMQNIADHLKTYGGGGLVIDYGYTGESRGNTLQAVRDHGFHPVLEQPGKADITAHVNFDELIEVLAENNINYSEVISQGAFLMRLGAELRAKMLLDSAQSDEQKEEVITGIERLISPTEMGELFKVLRFSSYPDFTPA